MATTPYVLTLPSPDSQPCRVLRDGVSAMAINAESSADAIAMAKAYHDGSYNATWAGATATAVAPASDMTGWALRLKITDPEGVDLFDATVEAADATVGLVKATGVLTTSDNPSTTETVTIGANVYTFQDVLTNVAGHVKIAANETLTLVNLKNAINGSGGTAGVDYAALTVAHPTVEATASAAHTVSVRALSAGSAGNAIATTDTLGGGDGFAAVTLTGGIGTLNALSALALAMVVQLNAATAIAGAAFDDTTHVLKVAETTDSLGDHQVYVWLIPNDADRTEEKGITGMVASQVDGGAAGDALTVTFRADTYTVPTLLALLGA